MSLPSGLSQYGITSVLAKISERLQTSAVDVTGTAYLARNT